MNNFLRVFLLLIVFGAQVSVTEAVTRYVIPGAGATGCTNGASTYDPTTNTCGSGSSLVYTSHNNVVSAMQSCDVAIYRAGSYAGSANIVGTTQSGTASCNTVYRGYYEASEWPVLTGLAASPTLAAFQLDGGIGYVEFSYLEFDMSASGGRGMCVYLRGNAGGTHHIRFIHNRCHDVAQAISVGALTTAGTGNNYFADNLIYRIGLRSDLDPPGKNTFYGVGSNTIVERNIIHDVCNGISIYTSSGGSQDNVIVRSNILYNVGRRDLYAGMVGMQCQTAIAQPSAGSGVKIYDNVIYDSFTLSTDVAIRLYLSYTGTAASIYHNTIYNTTGKGISVETGTGALVKNNIAYLTTGTGVSVTGGTGSASNNLTTDPSFVDAANDNYSLAAGSAAIDAGASALAERPCNGTCDIGAYETFGFSSGSLSGNTAEITLGMNLNTPVQPTPAGWSLTCTPNPTACITPVVTSVSLKTGTSSTVVLTFSGGNCSTNQTWTVSYSQTTGATTDSANIGGAGVTPNQELSTITTQALTNACTGGGGSALPGTPYIIYQFDDNGSDTSGNNLHATLNGTSFVDAKHYRGLKTDSGQDDYAEIPYFSGVNPSTQSLTIAGGLYIDPADVGTTRAVGGAGTGSSQRFHIYYTGGTWRLAVQANGGSTPSEFSVQSGWNHVCVTFNSTTDTATMWVNRVAGASSGSSVQTYTSFVFPGNFRIGRFVGSSLASGPNHIYDRWVVYQSVADCAAIYDNWEAASAPWVGNLAIVASRFLYAKSVGGVAVNYAGNDTAISLPAGAIFAFADQMDCTVADCTGIGRKLTYTCAQCPSAGSELDITGVSTEGIEFLGSFSESGLLSGDHGANLTGALTRIPATTNVTSAAVPILDLALSNSTVMRWLLRIPVGTPEGRTFCIRSKEQTGVELDNYSLPGGLCVTVGKPNAEIG